MQYTGQGQFPIAPHVESQNIVGRARWFDVLRLSLVLSMGVLLISQSVQNFNVSFPEPISRWHLQQLEDGAGPDTSMLPGCLDSCTGSLDEHACTRFCHEVEWGRTLTTAGMKLAGVPTQVAGEYRSQQADTVQAALDILARSGETCEQLAAKIGALPVWSLKLQRGVEQIYSHEIRDLDAEFSAADERVTQLLETGLRGICRPPPECPANPALCL